MPPKSVRERRTAGEAAQWPSRSGSLAQATTTEALPLCCKAIPRQQRHPTAITLLTLARSPLTSCGWVRENGKKNKNRSTPLGDLAATTTHRPAYKITRKTRWLMRCRRAGSERAWLFGFFFSDTRRTTVPAVVADASLREKHCCTQPLRWTRPLPRC